MDIKKYIYCGTWLPPSVLGKDLKRVKRIELWPLQSAQSVHTIAQIVK